MVPLHDWIYFAITLFIGLIICERSSTYVRVLKGKKAYGELIALITKALNQKE